MSGLLRSHEEKINVITKMAIEATAASMLQQDKMRKKHLFHLRDQMATEIIARQNLLDLVKNSSLFNNSTQTTVSVQNGSYCIKMATKW